MGGGKGGDVSGWGVGAEVVGVVTRRRQSDAASAMRKQPIAFSVSLSALRTRNGRHVSAREERELSLLHRCSLHHSHGLSASPPLSLSPLSLSLSLFLVSL